MDLATLQRQAVELASQRSTLDKLDTPNLARLAKKTYSEVEKAIGEGTGAPWYVNTVPLARSVIDYFQEDRFKSALEKLKYAKGWLSNAESAKSDSGQRLAYKQSFSDSAHALQLFVEEKTKGSTVGRLYDGAVHVVDEKVNAVRGQFLIGTGVAIAVALAFSQAGKKK